jgi:gliding motility-associated-like protein
MKNAFLMCLFLFISIFGMSSKIWCQQLKWSSYVGGFGFENLSALATANSGSVFLAYITDNQDSIITADAAFPRKQTPFSASVLAKLNPDQSIAWATYFTGDSLSQFNIRSLVYDGKNHIYILGSGIGNGFPINNDLPYGSPKGGAEAYIAKFDTNGVFVWAKCISSNGFDLPAVAAIDNDGDLWLGGHIAYPESQPFAGIVITSNAYQAIPNPVNVPNTVDEMFIACIDKSGSLLYSSYFGGSGWEDPIDISVDRNNNIHYLLRTSSLNIEERNNPFTGRLRNRGAYIIRINKNTFRVNYAAPIPLHQNDVVESLKIGKDNALYLLAKTNNLNGYTPIPESILSSGNTAIILHEISPDFQSSKTWAINGFDNNDIGAREIIATDSSLFVLLFEKKNTIRTNPNAFQKLNNGLIDAFIFNFGYDFKPRWATYLGKSNDDFPLNMSNNGTTNWITGTTRSTDFYTSANAISKNLNDGLDGTSSDIFLTAFDCKSRNLSIVSNSETACLGTPLILKASESFSFYSWNNSIQADSFIVNTDTLVQLQAIDSLGCIYFAKRLINFIAPPLVRSFDTSFCLNKTFEFSYTTGSSDSITDIFWSTGSTNKNIQLRNAGTYIAVVSNGCFKDSFEIRLEEIDCNGKYFIPNAFTPNNDGLNDIFDIKGTNIEQRTITIYNRWGQLIYEGNNNNMGWNGTYKGAECISGTYLYIFSVTDTLGNKQTLKGTVDLLQ